MPAKSPFTLFRDPKFLWSAFLCYGPLAIFLVERFEWQLGAYYNNILSYFGIPALASALCALMTVIIGLIRLTRLMIIPALIFVIDCSLIFSPMIDTLQENSFADSINPESSYVKKHCSPTTFMQDGKKYSFGICDLVIAQDGSDDFGFIYDTSGDILKFTNLSAADREAFAKMIRRYYNDDPNSGFEYANFSTRRYYKDFFDVWFDGSEDEGFTAAYGPPPKNIKSPYSPFF